MATSIGESPSRDPVSLRHCGPVSYAGIAVCRRTEVWVGRTNQFVHCRKKKNRNRQHIPSGTYMSAIRMKPAGILFQPVFSRDTRFGDVMGP